MNQKKFHLNLRKITFPEIFGSCYLFWQRCIYFIELREVRYIVFAIRWCTINSTPINHPVN